MMQITDGHQAQIDRVAAQRQAAKGGKKFSIQSASESEVARGYLPWLPDYKSWLLLMTRPGNRDADELRRIRAALDVFKEGQAVLSAQIEQSKDTK